MPYEVKRHYFMHHMLFTLTGSCSGFLKHMIVQCSRNSPNWDGFNSDHKSPPMDTALNKLNLVHIITNYIFKIYFNSTLPSKPSSPRCSLSVYFYELKYCMQLLSPIHDTCPTRPVHLNLITTTILGWVFELRNVYNF